MSDEIDIKFKPVKDDRFKVKASLGTAEVSWIFLPEDDDSAQALELHVGNTVSIIGHAMEAASNSQEES